MLVKCSKLNSASDLTPLSNIVIFGGKEKITSLLFLMQVHIIIDAKVRYVIIQWRVFTCREWCLTKLIGSRNIFGKISSPRVYKL